MKKIGLIGGSGLENLNIFNNSEELELQTPYGSPSSSFFKGEFKGNEIYILSRHGREHTIPPTQVNNRANIYAFRQLQCESIFATTACGSLKEEIGRGDLVILDQFIDFSRLRTDTFFEAFKLGEMGHTAMPDPFSEPLRQKLISAAIQLQLTFHSKGCVVTIEGPRFSTRAESYMFRLLGADVINMSTATEAALANEAGIPYAAIALSTDYDSWKHDEEPVTWQEILKVMNQNAANVTKLLVRVLETL